MPTPAVRNLIREGKTHQIYSALQTGAQFGMQTMDTVAGRARAPAEDLARARRVALLERPEELRRLMGTVRVA